MVIMFAMGVMISESKCVLTSWNIHGQFDVKIMNINFQFHFFFLPSLLIKFSLRRPLEAAFLDTLTHLTGLWAMTHPQTLFPRHFIFPTDKLDKHPLSLRSLH